MNRRLAESVRIGNVQAPMIPVVGEWISQHPGTISLGQGIVHYSPPPQVAEAVCRAVHEDAHVNRYGLVRGTKELLAAIESKLQRENGIDAGSRLSVVVTAGSNMGFVNAILAIADVDDEILLLSPYYFNHEMAIAMLGCRAVIVPTDPQYQIDWARLQTAIGPRTRAIVTVSPCNPTGAVFSRDSLERVNQVCKAHGIYHINDEAYEYFVYDELKHFSPGSIVGSEEHTISLYSLSKAYGMAGWRVGYMAIPRALETAVKKVQDTNLVCPSIVSQIAATAALRVGAVWPRQHVPDLAQVRDLVLQELAKLGARCQLPKPNGAFYALVQVESDKSDVELVEALIREFGVAVMPGSSFGMTECCALRIAYGALDRETVAHGVGRLVRGLDKLLG